MSAITWASFRFSDALSRLLSINSVGALNRILGFFILAIDLVVTGGKNILVTLTSKFRRLGLEPHAVLPTSVGNYFSEPGRHSMSRGKRRCENPIDADHIDQRLPPEDRQTVLRHAPGSWSMRNLNLTQPESTSDGHRTHEGIQRPDGNDRVNYLVTKRL